MKKILLAALIIMGGSFTVQAQKSTQPTPVHAQEHPRDMKLFKEKSGLLTASINANDGKAAQAHLQDIMMLMNYRGEELLKANAPKTEAEARFDYARKMKGLLENVIANKETVINLVNQAELLY